MNTRQTLFRHGFMLLCAALSATLLVPSLAHASDGEGSGVDSFFGAFGTEVPIAVPTFHGLEPEIKLVYSSTGGNSEVGFGWRLMGSSYIGRAGADMGAPRYDASDAFTLDGTELLPCATLGGTHCTEIQNYHRITRNEAANEWYVWRKDGTKGTYRAELQTAKGTFRWALSSMVDPRGNTVNYNYWCDGANECYLDTITYNGTTIKFHREWRTDSMVYASGAGLITVAYRLKSIAIDVGGSLARAYKLSYTSSASGARSLLSDVQQYGRDASVDGAGNVSGGSTLPAMSMQYRSNAISFSYPSMVLYQLANGVCQVSGGSCDGDNWQTISNPDINGDGRADVCWRADNGYYCAMATSAGTFGAAQLALWQLGNGACHVAGYSCSEDNWATIRNPDVNGDGKSDVCWRGDDGYHCALSLGNGTFGAVSAAQTELADYVYNPYYSYFDESNWRTISNPDLNADGKADLCWRADSGYYCAIGNGNGTFGVGQLAQSQLADYACHVSGGGCDANNWKTISNPDINGDAKIDVCWRADNGYYCALGNGNGTFGAAQLAIWNLADGQSVYYGGDNNDDNWSTISTPDINGDGMSDVCWRGDNGYWCALSNGDGTFAAAQLALSALANGVNAAYGGDNNGDNYSTISNPDANGDGLADVCWRGDSGYFCAPSNGNGTFGAAVNVLAYLGNGWGAAYGGDNNGDNYPTIRNADVNGDGAADVCWRGDSGYYCSQGLSRSPLVSNLQNGIGGATSVTYTASSNWANTYMPVGMVFQTVGSVTTTDGRGGSSTSSYNYDGGLWSDAERRFLGFRRATAVIDAAGNYTETYYHQHVGCIAKPEVTYFRNAAGAIYSYSQMFYNESATAPYTSLMTDRWDYECNLDGTCRRTLSQFGFDTYGNLIQANEYGDYDMTGDERTTVMGYVPNTGSYIVGLPAYKNVYAGIGTGGQLAERTAFVYDYNGDEWAAPTVGNQVQKRGWNSSTGGYDILSYQYDGYGNVVRETNAEGEASTYSYDPTYHQYWSQVCNAVGHCESYTYDPVLQVKTARTDANGKVESYSFDALGRPTQGVREEDGVSVTYSYLDWGNANGQRMRTSFGGDLGGSSSGGGSAPPPAPPAPAEYPGQTMFDGTLIGSYAWDYNMGYQFTTNTAGQITKLGAHFNGTATVRLYSYPSGAVLASANVTSYNGYGYADITPVNTYAGEKFMVAVYLAGQTGSYDGSYADGQTFGNITIDCVSAYVMSSTAMPTCYPGQGYFYGMADVAFVPGGTSGGGGGGGTPPPAGGTAERPGQTMFDGALTSTDVAWDFNLGYQFTANASGQITQLGGNFNGYKTVRLFSYPSGTLLASANISSANSFSYVDITPVNVTAGEKFVVAVYLAGSGGAYDTPYADGQTFGNITIDCVSMEIYGTTAMPTQCYLGTGWYYGMPDVTFVAAGSGGGSTGGGSTGGGSGDMWVDHYQDGLGRVYKSVRSDGTQRETIYNAAGRVWKESSWYDPSSETPRYQVYAYDGAGRQVQTTNPDGSYAQVFYGDDHVIKRNELGHEKVAYTDGRGRVVQIDERAGTGTFSTFYSYDTSGNLIETVDALGHSTTASFDSQGRKLSVCTPDTGCELYSYDRVGRMLTRTNAKGETVTTSYDDASRPVTETVPGVGTTTYYYDEAGHGPAIGKLTRMTHASGSVDISYNALGRQSSATKCVLGVCYSEQLGYDGLGRLASVTYPDGETVEYAYDAAGKLASVSGYVNSISYDPRGRITNIAYANGANQSYTYDANRQWLSTSQVSGAGGTLYQASYNYDAGARITSVTSTTDSLLNVNYAYDALDRLTQVTGAQSQSFAYDAIGRMTYNSAVGSYSYADGAHVHAVTQAGGASYGYDANGNMAFGDGRSFGWDAEDRMTSVTKNGNTTTYAYGPDGARVAKSDWTGTTRYFGARLERKADGTLVKYVMLGSMVVAKIEGGAVNFLHSDHLGSVQLVTDAGGAVAKSSDYAAFGETLATSGYANVDQGFGGHRRDAESGLIYMNARYYDAKLARFVSADTIVPEPGNPQSFDRYAFAYNNPISNADPSGHAPVAAAIIGAVIGVATGVMTVTLAVIAVACVAVGYITKNPLLMSIGQVILGFASGGMLGGVVAALTSPISPLDPKIKQIIGWAYTAYSLIQSFSSKPDVEIGCTPEEQATAITDYLEGSGLDPNKYIGKGDGIYKMMKDYPEGLGIDGARARAIFERNNIQVHYSADNGTVIDMDLRPGATKGMTHTQAAQAASKGVFDPLRWYTGSHSAYYGTLVGSRSFSRFMDNVFGAVHDGLVSMGQATFNWSINGNGSGGMAVTTKGGSFEMGGRAWGSLWRGSVRNHTASGVPTTFQLVHLGPN